MFENGFTMGVDHKVHHDVHLIIQKSRQRSMPIVQTLFIINDWNFQLRLLHLCSSDRKGPYLQYPANSFVVVKFCVTMSFRHGKPQNLVFCRFRDIGLKMGLTLVQKILDSIVRFLDVELNIQSATLYSTPLSAYNSIGRHLQCLHQPTTGPFEVNVVPRARYELAKVEFDRRGNFMGPKG